MSLQITRIKKFLKSFKASETLLGIETVARILISSSTPGFKASETLLGIETAFRIRLTRLFLASKPLKPF